MNNKWSRPENPIQKFFGKKERDFVKNITDEIVENVVAQTIIYFPIDTQKTNYHSLYNEAIKKVFNNPIRIAVLLEWKGHETQTTNYGIDKKAAPLKIHFHKKRLTEDQNLMVKEGDFVQFNDEFWEIVDLSEPRLLFGQSVQVETTATLIRAREELFDGTK